MSKIEFQQIYNNTKKNAENFLNSDSDQSLLTKYESYSSSLKQLTQVLRQLEDKEEVRDYIDSLLLIHKEVEDRLIKEKESLFKNIRSTLCREHVRHKYYTKSIKSNLVDRKS